MIGWMASSMAGHDKNKIYIIIEETDEYVWLCDGNLRKLENPKRKRIKHVQPIKNNVDEELMSVLRKRTADNNEWEINPLHVNERIKRAIKLYKQSIM